MYSEHQNLTGCLINATNAHNEYHLQSYPLERGNRKNDAIQLYYNTFTSNLSYKYSAIFTCPAAFG